jgi:predicted protein tyrosine phosphatase
MVNYTSAAIVRGSSAHRSGTATGGTSAYTADRSALNSRNWEITMSKMNRLGNCKNSYQGKTKKVLCVCSAGLLRSPTAAVVLSQEPFNFNTRACGADDEFALIPLDDVLLTWADEIVFMEQRHADMAKTLMDEAGIEVPKVIILNIPDNFSYRDQKLMKVISMAYKEETGFGKE